MRVVESAIPMFGWPHCLKYVGVHMPYDHKGWGFMGFEVDPWPSLGEEAEWPCTVAPLWVCGNLCIRGPWSRTLHGPDDPLPAIAMWALDEAVRKSAEWLPEVTFGDAFLQYRDHIYQDHGPMTPEDWELYGDLYEKHLAEQERVTKLMLAEDR